MHIVWIHDDEVLFYSYPDGPDVLSFGDTQQRRFVCPEWFAAVDAAADDSVDVPLLFQEHVLPVKEFVIAIRCATVKPGIGHAFFVFHSACHRGEWNAKKMADWIGDLRISFDGIALSSEWDKDG